MAYEVTATRKRPRTFDGLVGQEFVVSTLLNAVKSNRIAHAYLFAGPRGVGKTSAARILARVLNNPQTNSDQPNPNEAVLDDISRGRAIDVIEIDGASNTSVNDVRAIRDEVLFPPQASRYKIYIIDEVHMLSNSAFNALLKTIEEPPPYVIFIFATTEIHKVPATIRSRCQQFNFRLISLDLIKQKLSEACEEMGIQADDEALFWIAKEGTGSLRDSYTLFDQVVSFSGEHISLEKIRSKLGFVGLDQLTDLAAKAFLGNTGEALEALHGILQSGISVEQCIIDLAEYYRGVLFVQTGLQREALLGSSADRFYQPAVKEYTRGQVERIIALFLDLYRTVRYSLDPRCELELAVARLSRMRESLDGQEFLKRITELEKMYLLNARNPALALNQSNNAAPNPPIARETTQVREEPVAQPSSQQNQNRMIDSAETEKFKQLFLREKPMLASLLDSLSFCEIKADKLILGFDSTFSCVRAKEEASVLLQSAQKIWTNLKAIETVSNNKKTESVQEVKADPSLANIQEIFRADIIQNKE